MLMLLLLATIPEGSQQSARCQHGAVSMNRKQGGRAVFSLTLNYTAFSMAAVTNYHKLSDLNQHNFFFLMFLEIRNQMGTLFG